MTVRTVIARRLIVRAETGLPSASRGATGRELIVPLPVIVRSVLIVVIVLRGTRIVLRPVIVRSVLIVVIVLRGTRTDLHPVLVLRPVTARIGAIAPTVDTPRIVAGVLTADVMAERARVVVRPDATVVVSCGPVTERRLAVIATPSSASAS